MNDYQFESILLQKQKTEKSMVEIKDNEKNEIMAETEHKYNDIVVG